MKNEKMPPFPFGPNGPKGMPNERKSMGKPPLSAMPPLVDVSFVKRSFLDIKYGESKAQVLDLFLPDEGEGPFPLVIHIHGGGFALGDKRDGHVRTLLNLIKKGYAFASINYRLSDEAIFPAAVIDCREALRFIKSKASFFHIDPSRIATIGGSAGGNLSAMLAMEIPNGNFYQEKAPLDGVTPFIKMAIDWFGPTDFLLMDKQANENGISFSDHHEPYSAESGYMGKPLLEADPKICALANPMNYISKEMAPLFIEHGQMDHLVPFQQSEIFYNALLKAGLENKVKFHPLPSADHEDKQFDSDENMSLVYSWLKENL